MESNDPTISPLESPEHPWKGFAHPDHQVDEHDSLVRTLRFALIQFNKFWVEVNAFPVFMNELKGSSVTRVEEVFQWIQSNPRWADSVPHARLVPELRSIERRAAFAVFCESVQLARVLRSAMRRFQEADLPDSDSLSKAQAHLGVAIALARQLGLEDGRRADVEKRVAEISSRVERNLGLSSYFGKLARECGLPEAIQLREAGRVFQALDYLRRTPAGVWGWRKPQILGAAQKIRIEAWQDRARPILEARKRLKARFNLDSPVTVDQLRSVALALQSGGTFRAFSAGHKEAVRQYGEWLRSPDSSGKAMGKESVEIMVERLQEWAGYLEQKSAFEQNGEAQAFFSPHFLGIDTDFSAALAAHAWAAGLRSELKVMGASGAEDPASPDVTRDAAFCARLIECVFTLSETLLKEWIALGTGDAARAVHAILLEPEYATGREFADVGAEEGARHLEGTRLLENLSALLYRSDVTLRDLGDLRQLVEERLALIRRMDAASEIRAVLKTLYAGENTDLSPIEAARKYLLWIEGSPLPDSLKSAFLTSNGPGRLDDCKALVAPAQNGLSAVKDHLRRLETATRGQSHGLEHEPLFDLVQKSQRALKQPHLLPEWIEASKSFR